MSNSVKQRSGLVTERRAFGRRNCFQHARVALKSGREISCIIVNKSEGGALLQLMDDQCDADAFELIVEEDDIIVDCEVAHRTYGRIGVRYVRLPRRLSYRKSNAADSVGKIVAHVIARGR